VSVACPVNVDAFRFGAHWKCADGQSIEMHCRSRHVHEEVFGQCNVCWCRAGIETLFSLLYIGYCDPGRQRWQMTYHYGT